MSSRRLRITLLADEWNSSKGGLSTMNRELAIQLAKHPNVAVTFFVPKCTEEDKKAAGKHNISIVEAKRLFGFDEPLDWLSFPPRDLVIDVIIGHGVKLGKQAQVIRGYHGCSCWVQVVHTAPEELAMFKTYPGAISKGDEKQWAEVKLCTIADLVVAVGPKLQEFYSAYLSSCGKNVFNLTPAIFTDLSDLELSTQGAKKFRVLVFGRGDSEDFELKGFDIAAKAVAELNDRSYHFIFVGAPRGNEKQVADKLLEQGLSRSQLTVKVFLENRDDLTMLLSRANLAIIPSRTEGFGLTALEALSAGLPFLVSQNSGFGDALQEIPSGSSWIVPSEDPKKWAEAIKGVREKGRETALRECQELQKRYNEKYSWEKQCNDLVEKMLTLVKYEATLVKGNKTREDDDDFSDLQRGQEGFGRNTDTAPSSVSSNVNGSTVASSSDYTSTQRPPLLRATSWHSAGEEPDKDRRTSINRSLSHEPNCENSKERKKPTGKGAINFFFKTKCHKKSPEPSSHEKNSAAVESSLETSVVTSGTAVSSYSEAAPKPCENLSLLNVTEARKLSLTDSLSSGEAIASPTCLGCESGFMSSEEPSVSSEKTISIIHCFDLEEEAFEEVLKLYSVFGRSLGYKCHLDKLEPIQVAENKFRFVLNSVQYSDFLFICVSPELKRIFDSPREEISHSLEDDEQCMLRLVSDLILADLAVHASNRKGKFMTIILNGSSINDVPCFLNSFMKYHWPKDEYNIRCMIEGKPEIVPAPVNVGNVKTDPPSLVVKPAKLNQGVK